MHCNKHYLYSLPQSSMEWNWRFWSHCTGWCSESEPELENTKVSNYPGTQKNKVYGNIGPCVISLKSIKLYQLHAIHCQYTSNRTVLIGNESTHVLLLWQQQSHWHKCTVVVNCCCGNNIALLSLCGCLNVQGLSTSLAGVRVKSWLQTVELATYGLGKEFDWLSGPLLHGSFLHFKPNTSWLCNYRSVHMWH